MDAWASWILIIAICILGLDIVMLIGFMVYTAIRHFRCRKIKKIVKEDEVINYDDTVAIATEQFPVVYDESEKGITSQFTIPKTYSSPATPVDSSSHVDVPMYFAEPTQGGQMEWSQERTLVHKQPKLAISAYYDASANEVTIALIRGKNIDIGESTIENQHILVSAVLMPDGSIHHSSQGIPPNPLFKDKFTYTITGEELKNSKLKFNVWKIDKYSRKLPFGESSICMGELFKERQIQTSSVEDEWLPIEEKIELENETTKGELLISIQYLPGAERINITVIKGRDLQFDEFDKDAYVKVSAMTNGKIIKNKKTSTFKKTADPVINEMTSFTLSPQTGLSLDGTAIILSLYAHRSRGPHRRLLGRCLIGKPEQATPHGGQQWQNMLANPHKVLADWQELQ